VKFFTGLIKNQPFGFYLVVGFDLDDVNSFAEGIQIEPMFQLFPNGRKGFRKNRLSGDI
jgi:hypothetical protein